MLHHFVFCLHKCNVFVVMGIDYKPTDFRLLYLFHIFSHMCSFHILIFPTVQHPLCAGVLSKIYSVQNSQSCVLLIINDTMSSPVTNVHTSQCFAKCGCSLVRGCGLFFFSNKLIKVLKPHVSLFIMDVLRLNLPKM